MKFAIASGLLSFVGLAASATIEVRSCPQATRFGILNVSPTVVSPGDTISINVDLTCGVQNFGIVPQFLDYSIEVPADSNNGFEQAIILARRTIAPGALSDSFTTQVPHGFFTSGAPHDIVLTNIYPISGTDGSPVLVKGGVESPITINV